MRKFQQTMGSFFIIVAIVSISYGFYIMHEAGFSFWMVGLSAYYAFTVIFVLVIFTQRRHAAAQLAWIVIFVLLPGLGELIFLIFGARHKNRESIVKYKSERVYTNVPQSNYVGLPSDIKRIYKHESSIMERPVLNGDYKLYSKGFDAYESMFNDIAKAKDFILIQYYIVKPGEIWDEFKALLIKKASEGVEVKFMIDDFGRWALPRYEIKELSTKGINVKIFGKVYFPFIGSKNGYRTHRKIVNIDGQIIHTGGMNIGDEYANMSKQYGIWNDFQVRIVGAAVWSYTALFLEDWTKLTKEVLTKNYFKQSKVGNSKSLLIEDGPDIIEPILHSTLVTMIGNASDSITLSTPYFIPTTTIKIALVGAALAGVKVKIFIPGKPDKQSVLIATQYWARELMEYGIEFYSMNDSFIHTKIGLFDNKIAYLGTANIDMRSAFSQFEFIDIVSGDITKDINKLFNRYENNSTLLAYKPKRSRLWDKIARIVIAIFAPVM